MKKELKLKILNSFPGLFGTECRPQFDCGDGWFDLLYNLCDSVNRLNRPEDFKILSIKQKYAGLNVWGSPINDYLMDLFRECEQASYSVCERCGSTAKVQFCVVDGWEQVACYPCRKMLKAGWHEGCAEFNDQEKLAAKALLMALQAKLHEEMDHLFPGGSVKVTLKGHPKKSYIVVKDSEGRVYAC